MIDFAVSIFDTIPFIIVQVLGAAVAIHAIMNSRTPAGAIAWAFSLITIPYLSIPTYIVIGRRKLQGYLKSRRKGKHDLLDNTLHIEEIMAPYRPPRSNDTARDVFATAMERLAGLPFTIGNSLDLLINGRETYETIFKTMGHAQDYILVGYYTVRDDTIGCRLKEELIKHQSRGVQIYFLYDAIGSYSLPDSYCSDLREAGIKVNEFGRLAGLKHRFQLNLRNHRKIVVIDGKVGFTGGHNVGDEYLGKNKKYGNWRDTHIKVEGPCVLGLQAAFLEDWHWDADEVINLNWTPAHTEGGSLSLAVPSGPSDDIETCSLFYVHLLNCAKNRAWIATPYFVPNEAVMEALKLAALRGVDVKVIVPQKPDIRSIRYATLASIEDAIKVGVKFYSYNNGFMHQKVMLVDNEYSVVGTANLDNRSFLLNFELMLLVVDQRFSLQVEAMLSEDFKEADQITSEQVSNLPLSKRAIIATIRLFAPLL